MYDRGDDAAFLFFCFPDVDGTNMSMGHEHVGFYAYVYGCVEGQKEFLLFASSRHQLRQRVGVDSCFWNWIFFFFSVRVRCS